MKSSYENSSIHDNKNSMQTVSVQEVNLFELTGKVTSKFKITNYEGVDEINLPLICFVNQAVVAIKFLDKPDRRKEFSGYFRLTSERVELEESEAPQGGLRVGDARYYDCIDEEYGPKVILPSDYKAKAVTYLFYEVEYQEEFREFTRANCTFEISGVLSLDGGKLVIANPHFHKDVIDLSCSQSIFDFCINALSTSIEMLVCIRGEFTAKQPEFPTRLHLYCYKIIVL